MRRLLGALTLVAADRAGAQSALTLVRQPREVVDAPSLSLRGGVAIVRPAGTGDRFADDVARLYGEAYDTYRDPQRSTACTSPTRCLGDISGINGRRQDLRDGYPLVRDEYERLWLADNRPYWLRNVLARYDLATRLWIGRADRVDEARQRWYRESALPTPAEVGIPEVGEAP